MFEDTYFTVMTVLHYVMEEVGFNQMLKRLN